MAEERVNKRYDEESQKKERETARVVLRRKIRQAERAIEPLRLMERAINWDLLGPHEEEMLYLFFDNLRINP